jgi:hypothetical protein
MIYGLQLQTVDEISNVYLHSDIIRWNHIHECFTVFIIPARDTWVYLTRHIFVWNIFDPGRILIPA